MRAITVWQPWASLIIVGAKPFEFRSWSPRERGGKYAALIGQRIVIHASAAAIDRMAVRALIRALEAGGDDAASTCLKPDLAMPILEQALVDGTTTETGGWLSLSKHGDLPWSSGLGTAVLGEPRNGVDIAETEFGLTPEPAEPIGFNPHSGAENPFGVDDEMGGFDSDRREHANFGWPMLDIERWEEPIPMRGAQGFWTWPTPATSAL